MNDPLKPRKHFKVYSQCSRPQKKSLTNLINKGKYHYGKSTLKMQIIQLTPSYEKACDVFEELTIDEYSDLIDLVVGLIYSASRADIDENVKRKKDKLLEELKSNFKRDRKLKKDKLSVHLKTSITVAESENLKAASNSYNYNTTSSYLRDLIRDKVEIRPNQSKNFQAYFSTNKRIAQYLEELLDKEDAITAILKDSDMTEQFTTMISKIKKDNEITRNLVMDNHTAKTAEMIALKHLSASKLKKIYEQKLIQENE
ncbi:hypothetical protein [Vibrio sp. 1291-1]|uniref:hypothetical protein n=1 Tax=Vibrio sp. 1291-1 TaxID=3074551 RepID=UPI00296AC7FD|nr:hypothetical protein [Vibrio sp. 1291-1]MDW3640232.1 hypothetical protein [Vibrio sp. 1291-1]